MPSLPRRAYAAYRRARPYRARLHRSLVADRARGARVLGVGGPSEVFTHPGLFPVYETAASVDHVNFAAATLWDEITERDDRLVAEATALTGVPSGAYDLLLASHVLEHVANPLAALREWGRVLAPGGLLLALVPERATTFDHRRPVTTIEHLRADDAAGVGEDDLTHLEEILALHDLGRDPGAGTREEFETRSRDNLRFRALHHHVFDAGLMEAALAAAGLRVQAVDVEHGFHVVGLATN